MTDTNSKAQVTEAMVEAAMDEARCYFVSGYPLDSDEMREVLLAAIAAQEKK